MPWQSAPEQRARPAVRDQQVRPRPGPHACGTNSATATWRRQVAEVARGPPPGRSSRRAFMSRSRSAAMPVASSPCGRVGHRAEGEVGQRSGRREQLRHGLRTGTGDASPALGRSGRARGVRRWAVRPQRRRADVEAGRRAEVAHRSGSPAAGPSARRGRRTWGTSARSRAPRTAPRAAGRARPGELEHLVHDEVRPPVAAPVLRGRRSRAAARWCRRAPVPPASVWSHRRLRPRGRPGRRRARPTSAGKPARRPRRRSPRRCIARHHVGPGGDADVVPGTPAARTRGSIGSRCPYAGHPVTSSRRGSTRSACQVRLRESTDAVLDDRRRPCRRPSAPGAGRASASS